MECPRCNAEARLGALFCWRCGDALGGAGVTVPQGAIQLPERSSPSRSGGRAPWGGASRRDSISDAYDTERKQITVLFADICDSTRLIAGKDPENAWKLLEPVIQTMIDSVEAYGGTVNQIQGDGIMALMGAPVAHEDHALRACYAALRILQKISEPGTWRQQANDHVRLHIGIASGEVLVGRIGSGLNRSYNANGEVIHLASRLQHLARPGQILCSAETARQIDGFIDVNQHRSAAVRGLDHRIDIFELRAARTVRTRFHAVVDRGLTPFIGREHTIALLQERLRRAQGGAGQVVELIGDAGVGKSRLIWELTHSPLTASWRVLESGGAFYAKDIPYHTMAGLLRDCFTLGELDPLPTVHRKLADGLAAIGIGWDRVRPGVQSLLGLEPREAAWASMDPIHRREAVMAAFIEIVTRLSDDRPLLIVVEDLHWTDSGSRELLSRLIRLIAGKKILLLVDYRPEHEPEWSAADCITRIVIDPLAPSDSGRLVQTMLGDPAAIVALQKELVERTAGNPFFLEETMRALIEARVLVGQRGALRLTSEPVGKYLPASIRAVLGARIDRLTVRAKRLLQVASAIGSRFPVTLLSTVMRDLLPETLQADLHRLVGAGLIYAGDLYPEPEYRFTHALTQEVAYDGLLRDRRRRLHRRIVTAIETLYPDRLIDQAETLAFHAAGGEDWSKLATYGRMSGRKAAAQSAYREAVRHFEQALNGLVALPRSDAILSDAIDIRFELRNALFPLGEVHRDLQHLRIAEDLAKALQDRRRLAWTSAYMARDLALLGNPDEALEACMRVMPLARDIADHELGLLVRSYTGQAHYALGNYRRAADILRDLVNDIPENDRRTFGLPLPGHIFFRVWLVWALARLGDFAEAERVARDLLHAAADSDQPLSRALACYSQGFWLVHNDDFETAVPPLEAGLELCRQWGLSAWFTNLASSLGYCYARLGRVAAGQDLLGQAIRQTRTIGIMVSHAAEVAWLAEACLIAGAADEAAEHAQAAVDLARHYKERGNEANALRVLADALRHTSGHRSRAEPLFEQALALATECEMQPVIAACRQRLAALRDGSNSIIGSSPGSRLRA